MSECMVVCIHPVAYNLYSAAARAMRDPLPPVRKAVVEAAIEVRGHELDPRQVYGGRALGGGEVWRRGDVAGSEIRPTCRLQDVQLVQHVPLAHVTQLLKDLRRPDRGRG